MLLDHRHALLPARGLGVRARIIVVVRPFVFFFVVVVAVVGCEDFVVQPMIALAARDFAFAIGFGIRVGIVTALAALRWFFGRECDSVL